MQICSAIAQRRTTDLTESTRFYTTKLGLSFAFQYEDFYAGVRAGDQRRSSTAVAYSEVLIYV
jgi:hypothetical protein